MATLSGTTISALWWVNIALVMTMIDKKTEREITAIIVETLKKHSEIYVKDLGSFSVQHQKQDHRQVKDGRVLLAPPFDTVKFDPEN